MTRAAYVLFLLLLLEGGLRLTGMMVWKVPFFQQQQHILRYYPELKPYLLHEIPTKNQQKTRLLVLGGSVVTHTLCDLGRTLNGQISANGKPIEVHSLARYAHNSLDSRIKMEYLVDYDFDYAFVYHGINDCRTNNCPADVFDEGYRHIEFYREVQLLRSHPEINFFASCYYLHWLYNQFQVVLKRVPLIPREYLVANAKLLDPEIRNANPRTNPEAAALKQKLDSLQNQIINRQLKPVDLNWLKNGSDIKSARPFKNNLLAIVAMCKERKVQLLLTPFAFYQPKEYTLEAFMNNQLDYDEQRWPTELYGLPQNVVKGIQTHNRITRNIIQDHPEIMGFNFPDSIGIGKIYFNDICHLAPAGCEALGEILLHQLKQAKHNP